MQDQTSPFAKLLAELARAEVQFLTVGGVACALCGFVRTTEDVDILVRANSDNIHKLLAVLEHFGEGHARELTIEDFTDEEGALRVIEDFPLDIFVRLRGHRLKDLMPYASWHDAGDVQIPYLNAEGLIRLKQESSREKDRIDVSALRRIIEDRASP